MRAGSVTSDVVVFLETWPAYSFNTDEACVLAVLHGALSCCNRRDMCAGGVTWGIVLLLQT